MPMKNSFRPYTIVEIVVAMGILAILTACFFSSLQTLSGMERAFGTEGRATLALDNTVERFAALKSRDAETLRKIFDIEFERSSLKEGKDLKKAFALSDGRARIALLKASGKAWAEVEIKCER